MADSIGIACGGHVIKVPAPRRNLVSASKLEAYFYFRYACWHRPA